MSHSLPRTGDALLASDRRQTRGRLGRFAQPVLMVGGVLVIAVAAAAWWLDGGGTVVVDDAYIRAAKLAVSTDVSGIVARVEVREGQAVRAGDVLLRLDDAPFRIALEGARAALAQTGLDVAAAKEDYRRALREGDAAEAQLRSDQADYARFAGLARTGAVTASETEDARYKAAADAARLASLTAQAGLLLARLNGDAQIDPAATPAYRAAKARVDEAARQLDHTVLRAPFDGVATEVASVQPGLFLAAASPALELVSRANAWAEGNPKETELTWVAPGDHVDLAVDTYPGRRWSGIVDSIAPAAASEFSVLPAQNSSGNWIKVVQRIPLRVRIAPQADAPSLRAGMSVEMRINTGHARRLADLWP